MHKYFLPFLDVPSSLHSSLLFALAVPNGQTLGTAMPVFPFLVLLDIGDIVRDGAAVRSQRLGYPALCKDTAAGTVI